MNKRLWIPLGIGLGSLAVLVGFWLITWKAPATVFTSDRLDLGIHQGNEISFERDGCGLWLYRTVGFIPLPVSSWFPNDPVWDLTSPDSCTDSDPAQSTFELPDLPPGTYLLCDENVCIRFEVEQPTPDLEPT